MDKMCRLGSEIHDRQVDASVPCILAHLSLNFKPAGGPTEILEQTFLQIATPAIPAVLIFCVSDRLEKPRLKTKEGFETL